MFAEGLQVVEEMKRRGAKIMDDAKIWSAEHYKLSEIRDWSALSYGRVLWQPLFLACTNPLDALGYEMRDGFTTFVRDLKGTKIHAIEDLVEYNQKHPERSYADGKL